MNSRDKGARESVEWRPIPSAENLYEASSNGDIRSVKRATTKGVILKQYISPKNGYAHVSICIKNRSRTRRVHVLVAEAFFGERAKGQQVNHIDGNKINNAVKNLEYCTQSQNMKHAYQTGLEKPVGIEVIDLDTKTRYKTATEAAKSVGGGRGGMVLRVCRGERSHYRGCHFAFYKDYINNTIPDYKGKTKRKASYTLWR